ncbi:MAG: protein kinase [Myxococcales bacterium]|nr:protein kinase [Myxococcales bacterium]
MAPSTADLGASSPTPLAVGASIGGRFAIDGFAKRLGEIGLYQAHDQKTKRPVSVWAMTPGALTDAQVEMTRRAVRAAATIAHRDLVSPFGTFVLPSPAGATLCIATEPFGELSLGDRMDALRKAGAGYTLEEAYPYIDRIAYLLGIVHRTMAHGCVAPHLIRIEGDRVRLAGLGLLTPLVVANAVPLHYIAPEVRNGAMPSAQSDLYTLGVILHEMLTGRRPHPDIPPSSIVQGLSPAFDVIFENCIAPAPRDRFPTLAAFRQALSAMLGPAVTPARDEDEIPVEFDLSAVHGPPPPSGAFRALSTVPVGDDIPVEFDLSVDPLASPGVSPVEAEPRATDADLGTLLKAVTRNDADRWMFAHNGLDHGPLTARDLIAAITRGEVAETDLVTNMDTRDARKLLEWPQYREFVETAREKRQSAARKAATVEALAEEGAAKKSKAIIAAAGVFAFLALGAVFWMTVGPGARRQRTAAEIDSLISRGELRVQTSNIVLLPPPPPSARRSGGGGGGGAGGMSYEAAMSQAVDYNFGGAGPGGGTLNDSEIMRPLNASLGRLAGCLGDGSARQVQLRIAIGGNGRAMGVTVANGSAGLKSCVGGVIRGLSWRAFGGPRVGLSWSFGF